MSENSSVTVKEIQVRLSLPTWARSLLTPSMLIFLGLFVVIVWFIYAIWFNYTYENVQVLDLQVERCVISEAPCNVRVYNLESRDEQFWWVWDPDQYNSLKSGQALLVRREDLHYSPRHTFSW